MQLARRFRYPLVCIKRKTTLRPMKLIGSTTTFDQVIRKFFTKTTWKQQVFLIGHCCNYHIYQQVLLLVICKQIFSQNFIPSFTICFRMIYKWLRYTHTYCCKKITKFADSPLQSSSVRLAFDTGLGCLANFALGLVLWVDCYCLICLSVPPL